MQRLRFVFLVSFVLSVLAAPAAMAGTRAIHRPVLQVSTANVWTWITQRLGDLVPAFAQAQGTMDPDGRELPAPPPAAPSPVTTDAQGTMDPDGNH